MVHLGIARWREEWIARKGKNKRVAGVWDARLEREAIVLRDGRRLTYFLDGPPAVLAQEQREQQGLVVPIASSPAAASPLEPQQQQGQPQSLPNLGGVPPRRQDLPHIFVFHAMFLSGNVFLMKNPPTDYVLVCVNRPGYFGSDAPPQPKKQQKNNILGFRNTSSLGKDHDDRADDNDDIESNRSKNDHDQDSVYAYKDFAKDMEELANHLRIRTFLVAGHSSGGPCALACASHLTSRRVAAVGLLSSDPEYAHHSAPNKRWINDFGVGTCLPILLERVLCCLPFARHASAGVRNDYRLETSLYCFETESIAQPVTIYVGEHDDVLPPDISRHMHQRLPNSTLHVVPKVGHLSLLRQEVLNDFFETMISSATVMTTTDSITSTIITRCSEKVQDELDDTTVTADTKISEEGEDSASEHVLV
ncbi:hypothetical protein ACA910_015990 [Epithemia clementina (nom. ined.)]